MGRQFPERPILVQELAELLGMSRRALAESMLPKALPALFVKGDKGAIEKMAKLAGYKTTQRMMLDYGHHPVAACLMYQTPPLADFMPLVEEVTGQDFLVMARAIMPRIITEMVLQTGAGHGWSHNGDLPKDAINHTAHMLSSLAAEAAERDATQGQGPETQSTAEFLAEGDHVTRMLKEFGDALDSKLPSVQGAKVTVGDVGPVLNTVRSVLVLVQLTGPYVGRFLPQFMVLLGAAVRPANHSAVRMQGLAGWLCLVRALTEHAPLQLSGIVTQIVVTLMDSLQESGAVGFAAARVVHQLIDVCREHFKDKLRSIPPLPQSPELRHVNTKLQEERGTLSTTEHVSLLLESLGNEALSVRSMALQELRGVLAARRETFLSLQNTNPALFQQLIGALLKSSEPEAANAASVAAQQACAECLGMLGATDPSRVQLEPQPPRRMCRSETLPHQASIPRFKPSLHCVTLTVLGFLTLRLQYLCPTGHRAHHQAPGPPPQNRPLHASSGPCHPGHSGRPAVPCYHA